VGLQRGHVEDEGHAFAMGGDGLRWQRVEPDNCLGQVGEELGVFRGAGEPVPHAPHECVEVPPDDVVLRGVITEERPAGDTGRLGDVLNCRGVETTLVEQRKGHAFELDLVEDELLVEDVSIDGMCGVY
jgi:mycofactocin precursor